MTESNAGRSSGMEPLKYADAGLNRRPPLVTAVAVVSICFGCLSLWINCVFVNRAATEMRWAAQAPMQMRQITTARARTAAVPIRVAASQPAMRALTTVEVSHAIDYINQEMGARVGGDSLTAGQRKTLTEMLAKDGQSVIDPNIPLGSQTPGKLQMIRAWPSADHSVLLAVNHGSALNVYRTRLDAAGHQSAFPTIGRSSLTARPIPAVTAPMTLAAQNQQTIHDRYVSALLSVIVFGIGALLAILLLAGGIYLLRTNPLGVRLHWIYIVIKLSLSALTMTTILSGYFSSQTSLLFPLETPLTLVGCVYPISLLILLRSRTFRSRVYSAAGSHAFGYGDSRPLLFTAIGTISVCVGCLSLLVGGVYEYGAFAAMSQAIQDRISAEQQLRIEAIRIAAEARAAADRPPMRALSHDENSHFIGVVSSQLQYRGNQPSLSQAQADALSRLLSTPGQRLVDPDVPFDLPVSGMKRYQQVRISMNAARELRISTIEGRDEFSRNAVYTLRLDRDGRTLQAEEANYNPSSQNTAISSELEEKFDRDHFAAEFAAIVLGLDLAAAVLLLMGAQQMLRSKTRGIATHRLYAVVKIVTALACVFAVAAMFKDSPGEDVPAGMFRAIAVVPCLLALIYPIALLIALWNQEPEMQIAEASIGG